MKLKKPKKETPTLVNFKIRKDDLKLVIGKADKYAAGNISRWIRHAAINHVPKRKDLD